MTWSEPIRRALHIVPLVPDCKWFLRDPVFAGLHQYQDTPDGRSYSDTAHVVYPMHLRSLPANRRLTTIVIPGRPRGTQDDIDTIIHEVGHVTDEMTGREHLCTPISTYAEANRAEAFAEAFAAWLIPDYSDALGHAALDEDDFLWFEANLR